MSKLVFILIAIAIGAILTLQPPINAEAARRIGGVAAAGLLSLGVSFVMMGLLVLAFRWEFSLQGLGAAPWWVWLGGSIGVVFVVGTLWLAPILGVAVLFACVVLGQLIGSAVIDAIGFPGITPRPIDFSRIAGIAVVMIGVWLVQRPG